MLSTTRSAYMRVSLESWSLESVMIQMVAGDRETSTRLRFNPASCSFTRLQIASVGFFSLDFSYQMVQQPSLVSTWIRMVCIRVKPLNMARIPSLAGVWRDQCAARRLSHRCSFHHIIRHNNSMSFIIVKLIQKIVNCDL
jgi:hypothetical protein